MNWDEYYLNICNAIAKNSKCLSRQIGAILVDDKSIVSTGYNGPPRGVIHCGIRHSSDVYLHNAFVKHSFIAGDCLTVCPRQYLGFKSGEGLEYCIAGHAERNALINAARSGIKTKGLKMYMNCSVPCKDCLVEIINAGIEEIIFTEYKFYDEESKFLLDYIKSRCLNV